MNAENNGIVVVMVFMDCAIGLSSSAAVVVCLPLINFALNHWDTAARIGMIHARDGTQPGASAMFKPRNVFILSTTAAFSLITPEIAGNRLSSSAHWDVENL